MSAELEQLLPATEDPGNPPTRERILNATSGTPASERSTVVAAALARKNGAELLVVHVAAPSRVRMARLGPIVSPIYYVRDPYSSAVLLHARRTAWQHGAAARVVLMEGEPVPAILAAVRDFRVSRLVLGARDHRLPAWVAARTRASLLRRTTCPVQVVPEPAIDADRRQSRDLIRARACSW